MANNTARDTLRRTITNHPPDADVSAILKQYECGPVPLPTDPDAAFKRHLVFDHMVDPEKSSIRQKFQALGRSLKDLLAQRWLKTKQVYYGANPKRVYYLSMEFLIGRSLTNNICNLMVDPLVRGGAAREGLDLEPLAAAEPDAGLGNGGLGRLAACFIDSMATLQIPAHGYGLRYEYGMFRQEIANGYQRRMPRQLAAPPRPVGVRSLCRHRRGPAQCHRPDAQRRRGPGSQRSNDLARRSL